MRIAIVSPWPPEATGIADYAEDLAAQFEGLGKIVTRIRKTDNTSEVLGLLARQDVVIYQVGNHAGHHGWMLPLIERVPGVIHLHDIVLHHLAVGALERSGKLTLGNYAKVLDCWYSHEVQMGATVAFEHGLPMWAGDAVISVPLFEPVVRMARGIVVHSNFARQAVKTALPYVPVFLVPQAYTVTSERRRRGKLRTIGIMGGGESNRRFDWVAEALEAIHQGLSEPLTLEVIGQLNPSVEPQVERISGLENIELRLLGRIDDRSFEAAFSRVDLLIAFRHPTMGETSAIVAKAIQCGLPVVVSDQGWYSELPSCVRKLAPSNGAAGELADLLGHYLAHDASFAEWSTRCHEASFFYAAAAKEASRIYIDALTELMMTSSLRSHVADILSEWSIDPDGALSEHITSLDIQCGFPSIMELGDLLDIAAKDSERLSHDSDGNEVPRGPLNEEDFNCRLELVSGASIAKPEEVLDLHVTIHNHSTVDYTSPRPLHSPDFGIFIGYHWERVGEDSRELGENPRTRLVERIMAGKSITQVVRVRAPQYIGEYKLVVDLVQERVAWFRHRKGEPAVFTLQVGGVP
jgi:hypothetical protein